MVHLITQSSKYVMIILILIYAYLSFAVFTTHKKPKKQHRIIRLQLLMIYLIQLDGFLVLYLNAEDPQLIPVMYLGQLFVITMLQIAYRIFYKHASTLILNHMSILLVTGLIMLYRLSPYKAQKQLLFTGAGSILAILIPAFLAYFTQFWRRLKLFYGVSGILALGSVALLGMTSFGAKLSISIGSFSLQPSEFIKIFFVFFLAGMLYQGVDRRTFWITSILSAVFVLILVASKDLGGAVLYYVTYMMLIYVASRRWELLAAGSAFLGLASYAGYLVFPHVRTRVVAWLNPLGSIDGAGMQVSQSLFGIGTGGWFGFGLGQGEPHKIPVVANDFIFSAIAEEMGGLYAVGLILICISCLLMFFNIAMDLQDPFYKLASLGLAVEYGFQTFLMIGGVTRLIPSTGVTLPLVSYGGSSLLATIMMFSIIQGLYHKDSRHRHALHTEPAAVKDRPYVVSAYFFFGLFLLLLGYLVLFEVRLSKDFINSSRNSMQDILAEHVVRGEIRSSDGHVLAQTLLDDNGEEYRNYPEGRIFSHAVGYFSHGKSGIENRMNFSLLTSNQFFVDRIVNDLEGAKSIGDNVISTLDYNLQNTAWDALGDHRGAVVAIEPSSGKILALVSKPDFNPNTLDENWAQINSEGESRLFNRATQGLYAPGSTFKLVTLLEYYREHKKDINSYSFTCPGYYSADGETIHCAGNHAHGELDLKGSFAHSCNSSFANIGLTLDASSFSRTSRSLLFDTRLKTDLGPARSEFALSARDDTGTVMRTAIGQGETLVTPLYMAMLTSAVCNDGVLMRPYMVDHTENNAGITVVKTHPKKYSRLFSKEESAFLEEYMKSVVEEGTATRLSGLDFDVYGKTGSAQTSDSLSVTNAWFIGYQRFELEGEKKELAVAVIVEDAGAGSTYAVPVAKSIFTEYYMACSDR